ncbi:MAG TPA: DUF1203 domain-containing protein [Ornithinibacter sp.]|nr:DUF1203 domain-containing protein [Ornithinibacter sp.]
MSTFLLQALDPTELDAVRSGGRDVAGHVPEPFHDTEGGSQLRCCLRLSRPGDRLLLISHAPLAADRPWREVGPVFVHAGGCDGWAGGVGTVPAWFDDEARVVRAYDSTGAMRYDANRLVRAGEGVAAALDDVFRDPTVVEAHVRNSLAQCFVARAVRG